MLISNFGSDIHIHITDLHRQKLFAMHGAQKKGLPFQTAPSNL